MAVIHQSDLTSYARCPEAFRLERTGAQRKHLSATQWGTVGHFAVLNVLEARWRTGTPYEEALESALATFAYYWDQRHIHEITEPVDVWLPQQTHSSLHKLGLEAIKWYGEWTSQSEHEVLATEYGFKVPIPGTWDAELNEPHILAGTVDRLSFGFHRTVPTVLCADAKFGKVHPYLRHKIQFTSYLMATEQPEFWTGFRGEDGFGVERGTELFERFKGAYRRGEWVSLREMKVYDAGWRGQKDYDRFAHAVNQLVTAMKYAVYPLNFDGQVCALCDVAHLCAGVGLPHEKHGGPDARETFQPTREGDGRRVTQIEYDMRTERIEY